jgi:transposase
VELRTEAERATARASEFVSMRPRARIAVLAAAHGRRAWIRTRTVVVGVCGSDPAPSGEEVVEFIMPEQAVEGTSIA